jgi:hypothetical protein
MSQLIRVTRRSFRSSTEAAAMALPPGRHLDLVRIDP